MNEPPFGFSVPGDPGDDPDRGSGGEGDQGGGQAGQGGQGGVEGPFGPGGPLGDPQQLAEALRQFADLMAYQGGAINWDLAKNIARQTVAAKGDPSVLANERTEIADAIRLADLWLEDATTLPSGIRSATAWSRSEWVEATMPVWTTLCEPIAERAVDTMSGLLSVSQDDLDDLPPEMRSMMSALSGGGAGGVGALGGFGGLGEMMRRIGGMMVGGQAGAAVGALAEEIISSSDIGLPIGPEGTAALLPAGVAAFGSGLSVPAEEVRLFVALREAAHHRLFSHVPWLRARLLGAVEDYARGIKVDAEALRDAMPQIDPSNPEALNEALSGAALFSPEDSPEQKAALARLETLLALVEGWVATVVADAARNRLPQADALAEAIRRRRATGGPAERTFATLVGLELRPRRLREAAAIWRGLTDARGIDGRDQIWGHPDLLPTADDMDDPDAFVRGKPEIDISDLTGEDEPDGPEGSEADDGGPDPNPEKLSTDRGQRSRSPTATSPCDRGEIHKFSHPISTGKCPALHRNYPAASTSGRALLSPWDRPSSNSGTTGSPARPRRGAPPGAGYAVGPWWHAAAMRPALKAGLLPVWRDRDTLQIGIDPRRAIALSGMRRAAVVVGLLDGSRDRGQVIATAAERGIPGEATERILTLLAASGVLDDFPAGTLRALPTTARSRLAAELATASLAHRDPDGGARSLARRRDIAVWVTGERAIGRAVARILLASGIARVRIGDAQEQRPDLAVLVGRPPPDLLIALAAEAMPHLAVLATEAIGVVGPLVIPGLTSCLRCQDYARAARDPAWPLILAQIATRRPDPEACDAVLTAAVAAQAAAQVLTAIDRTPAASAAVNGTLELVLPDWRWRRRTWQPHPACSCSNHTTSRRTHTG